MIRALVLGPCAVSDPIGSGHAPVNTEQTGGAQSEHCLYSRSTRTDRKGSGIPRASQEGGAILLTISTLRRVRGALEALPRRFGGLVASAIGRAREVRSLASAIGRARVGDC